MSYQAEDQELDYAQEEQKPSSKSQASTPTQEEEVRFLEPYEIKEILQACRVDHDIISLLISSEVSNQELHTKLSYRKFGELLDMEYGVRGYKELNGITFRYPSEYLEIFAMKNPNIKIGSYGEKMKYFEALIFEFFALYRDNSTNLEQNLNRAFDEEEMENYDRCLNNYDILNSTKQRLFIVFILQKLTTIEQSRDWLRKQFLDRATKMAKGPEDCDVFEFRAMYSRNFDRRKLLSLCFGVDYR